MPSVQSLDRLVRGFSLLLSIYLSIQLTARNVSAPDQFLRKVEAAVKTGDLTQLAPFFANSNGDHYLVEMAPRIKGLSHLDVAMIPSPPGWRGYGKYWMIFHTTEDVEQDHDPVYEVSIESGQFKLGKEVPQNDLGGWNIQSAKVSADLAPQSKSLTVDSTITLNPGQIERAPAFRLNDFYDVKGAKVLQASSDKVSVPEKGEIVRAGSLLIPWDLTPKLRYEFRYTGVIDGTHEDKLTKDEAAVTALWVPSLGQDPFKVDTTVTGPPDWKLRSEGVETSRQFIDGRQLVSFSCDLPISFPKIIGGPYSLVASKVIDGQTFSIWQLPPVKKDVADNDLQKMIEAAKFFQSHLGPLPFAGYECYDSPDYYGIESYSHTLLQKGVTHFISHEMGHSYFGGYAPCAYVDDTWNEGVTEYVDSVLLLKDADHSLENAYSSLNVRLPLSKMSVAWANGSATYFRGCYVMRMLENEIGLNNIWSGLKSIVDGRVGKRTTWDDLRDYFERASGEKLDWFWNQWIDGGQFPTIELRSVSASPNGSGYLETVELRQSGTTSPFRLTTPIEYTESGVQKTKLIKWSAESEVVRFQVDSAVTDVKLAPFGYCLCHLAPK